MSDPTDAERRALDLLIAERRSCSTIAVGVLDGSRVELLLTTSSDSIGQDMTAAEARELGESLLAAADIVEHGAGGVGVRGQA